MFVVRCSLPRDPPVGGHSCNRGIIPRFHRAVCTKAVEFAPNGVCALSMVMSIRLDTCMEALRSLARSSELEANRLPTAELRVRDFLTPVGTNRAAQRAALEELDNAVSREAELRPREASFWQAISDLP